MAASPYSTAKALGRPVPSHVTDPEDIDRVRAYGTYEDIWNNVPEAFEALLRAEDDPLARRYVPVVRDIIEATNRYLGIGMETSWEVIPGNTVTDEQMEEWRGRLEAFWKREELSIKFLSSKRWLLIKADSILHITADMSKPEGSRVRLVEVEPEQYFPIWDPIDGERVKGCFLASVVRNDEDEDIVQRIEYRRISTQEESAEFGAPLGSIFYRLGYFELAGWDSRDPDNEIVQVDPPEWAAIPEGAPDPFIGYPLPAEITSLPVYHVRNRRRGGKAGRFGTSEIQGLESVFAGIIQNTTDEDLAIALTALGVYYTDSGKSRDKDGAEIDWEIGPASVAEIEKDAKFGRVSGVTTVQPIQDHIKYLTNAARGSNAAPAVAAGQVDAASNLSGVALRIQFMPTIAANAEREEEMASKWTHVLFDLHTMWFPAYEGWSALPVQPGVVFGDPLPPDRQAVITEVTTLVAAGIVTKEWAAEYLAQKLGYEFPKNMVAEAIAQQQAAMDAEGARIAAEAGQVPSGDPEA